MDFLERVFEDKKLVWFQETNRYMVMELPAFEVISRLLKGEDPVRITRWCSRSYHLPMVESKRFVGEVQQLIAQTSFMEESKPDFTMPDEAIPVHFYSEKRYLIGGNVYFVAYGNPELEHLIHLKFAHLETCQHADNEHNFRLFQYGDRLVFQVNGTIIGQWTVDQSHYLVGKFYMELLNRMYDKTESQWMAVFHASAISDGNGCMLFLGDSGSGKSTLSAILMSSGFDLLADDFVPVDAASLEAYNLPAAVSVKKKALGHLLPLYPELGTAAEFYYPDQDKTVRYLVPHPPSDHRACRLPCKALVFVNYQQDSGLILEKMAKGIAFKHLVPDSWISPLPGNAARFMDWFLQMPTYQLTYSDNERMVSAIKELFQHDE